MLANSTVMAMIAVSDAARAKEFYEGKLGLIKSGEEAMGSVMYKCGEGLVLIYPAPSAGKNESTSATWEVDDIKATVEELKGKGITFEKFDFPGAKYEGDILIMDGAKAAWFRDPDGNILGLSEVLAGIVRQRDDGGKPTDG